MSACRVSATPPGAVCCGSILPPLAGLAGIPAILPKCLAGRLNTPCRALAGITATLTGRVSSNIPGWRWRFPAVAGVVIAFYCFSI